MWGTYFENTKNVTTNCCTVFLQPAPGKDADVAQKIQFLNFLIVIPLSENAFDTHRIQLHTCHVQKQQPLLRHRSPTVSESQNAFITTASRCSNGAGPLFNESPGTGTPFLPRLSGSAPSWLWNQRKAVYARSSTDVYFDIAVRQSWSIVSVG